MAKAKTSIECKINKDFSIILKNLQEVYGHDDTLPFNADIYITNPEWGMKDKKVGTAWNDGWGGSTNICPESKTDQIILDTLDGYLKDHYEIRYKTSVWDVDCEYLISVLAEYGIYSDPKVLYITQVSDLHKKGA